MSDATLDAMVGVGVTRRTALEVGHRIRDARITSGQSTTEIATRIKVREHYLSAIEEGEWDVLPPGVNGRGLVRLYARDLEVAVPEIEPRFVPETSAQDVAQKQIKTVKAESFEPREKSSKPKVKTETVARTVTPQRTVTTRPAPSASRFEKSTTNRSHLNRNQGGEEDDTMAIDASEGQLASLLGIADVAEHDENLTPPLEQQVHFDNNVPIVKADQLAKEMFGEAPEAKAPKRALRTKHPVSEPVAETAPVEVKTEETKIVETAPVEPAPVEVKVEETKIVEPAPVEAAPVEAAPVEAVTPEISAPTPFQPSASEGIVNVDSESAQPLSKADDLATKIDKPQELALQKIFLVAISIAAVLAIIVGVSSFRKSRLEQEERALSTSDIVPTPSATVLSSTEATAPISNPTTTELTAATVLNSEVTSSTAATSLDPNAAVPVATATPVVPETPAAALPTIPPTVAPTIVPTATPPPAPTPSLGGMHKATLIVTDPVAMTIRLDGKTSFTGTREAGTYTIDFQKIADIYVEDASKVTLKAAGWDNHGPLGYEGRKRRVVLSAQPYPGFGRGSL